MVGVRRMESGVGGGVRVEVGKEFRFSLSRYYIFCERWEGVFI